MMQSCNLTVRNETENKLEFKEMQITNTIIWQFVTIYVLENRWLILMSSYDLICTFLYRSDGAPLAVMVRVGIMGGSSQ